MFSFSGSRFPSRAARSWGIPMFSTPSLLDLPARSYPFWSTPTSSFFTPLVPMEFPLLHRPADLIDDLVEIFHSPDSSEPGAGKEQTNRKYKGKSNEQQKVDNDEQSIQTQAIDSSQAQLTLKEDEKSSSSNQNTGEKKEQQQQVTRHHSAPDLFTSIFDPNSGFGGSGSNKGNIHLLLTEKDKEIEILAEVPGYKKENLSIKNHNGVLTVAGKREIETKSEDGAYSHYSSYSSSSSVLLPENADQNNIKAKFDEGKLKIIIGKILNHKTKHAIKIE